jgi:hypothetical protein
MVWIVIVVIVIAVLFALGRGGSSNRMVCDFSDCFDLLNKMKPTPWSQSKDMEPTQRAHCFFMPDIEDVNIITTARDFVRASMNDNPSGHRADFGTKIGTHEYADSFDESVGYYNWLLCCTFHKLKEGRSFRQSDFDLYTKKFKKRFCSPTVMIKEHSLEMPDKLKL